MEVEAFLIGIALKVKSRCVGISKEKYGMSHCPFLIASLTNKLSSTIVRGPILDHLSYQNDKELLSPIIQWELLAHRFSLLVMADQVLEKPRFLGLPFLQYFFLKTLSP